MSAIVGNSSGCLPLHPRVAAARSRTRPRGAARRQSTARRHSALHIVRIQRPSSARACACAVCRVSPAAACVLCAAVILQRVYGLRLQDAWGNRNEGPTGTFVASVTPRTITDYN
eukprot:scaffold8412_cov142-Isochrysis_galbana.AAC.2